MIPEVDVPVWPWNRHRHRCRDCGYLGRLEWRAPPGGRELSAGALTTVELGPYERRGLEPVQQPTCWLQVFDLPGEASYLEHEREAAGEGDDQRYMGQTVRVGAATDVIEKTRVCPYFTSWHPGVKFEQHQARHLGRGDRAWTLMVAMVSTLTGAVIAAVATLLAK